MYRDEIVKLIHKLSRRRHRRLMTLAKELEYPNLKRESIGIHRTMVRELTEEIDALFAKL